MVRLSGGQVVSNTLYTSLSPLAHIVGIGDFSGDGAADLLIQYGHSIGGESHTAGSSSGWFVRDLAQGEAVKGFGVNSADGTSELIVENVDSGVVSVWKQEGHTITSTSAVMTLAPQWAIEAVADYNGDGQADILSQNVLTGQYKVSLFSGSANFTTLLGEQNLGAPGFNYSVQSVLPASAPELQAQLWFQNAAGTIAAWNVQGGANTGGPVLASPGANWTMLGVGDFYGDLQPDILFRNTSDGSYAVWRTDGVKLVGGGTIGNPGGTFAFKAMADFNGDGHGRRAVRATPTAITRPGTCTARR